ncbi:MAG: TRAM domain-containing protein [Candidatus Omnitrophica bacterium]|nr:TRAM domain-containing protein [Candidatus Omnitrophota bacterium]MCM8826042.1 TRAM domain-containing protein [Candidatus Omnitrophota bacterium]
MVSLTLIRIFFIIIFGGVAYTFGGEHPLLYFIGGIILGSLIVFFEIIARRVSLKGLSAGVFGIILGLILAKLFGTILDLFNLEKELDLPIRIFITLIFIYLGITLGLKGKEEFSIIIPYVKFRRQELKEENIIVDTSSIIDGRILDIVKTGFIEARLIVPRFILNELQNLADSTDHLKRQKGKRGIEVLNSLKKEQTVEVVIHEMEEDGKIPVDERLIKLAKVLDSKILTTDYNLNQIAQLQGVKVLNINDLANALKPILLPGERFMLKLIKEGKEQNQAIGYLEDGTMVVVENSKWLIGKNVEVEVTSVLQSPSGRIIFTKIAG